MFLQSDYIVCFSFLNVPLILNTSPEIISTNYHWGLVQQLLILEYFLFYSPIMLHYVKKLWGKFLLPSTIFLSEGQTLGIQKLLERLEGVEIGNYISNCFIIFSKLNDSSSIHI